MLLRNPKRTLEKLLVRVKRSDKGHNTKKIVPLAVEPTTKKTRGKMMLPVRARPMGQVTHSGHLTSKSPNSKIDAPVGVEPRGL